LLHQYLLPSENGKTVAHLPVLNVSRSVVAFRQLRIIACSKALQPVACSFQLIGHFKDEKITNIDIKPAKFSRQTPH
jgi:hypothetical protein